MKCGFSEAPQHPGNVLPYSHQAAGWLVSKIEQGSPNCLHNQTWNGIRVVSEAVLLVVWQGWKHCFVPGICSPAGDQKGPTVVSFKRESNGMKPLYSSILLPVGNETGKKKKKKEVGVVCLFICFPIRASSAVTLNLYPLPTPGTWQYDRAQCAGDRNV